MEQTNSQAMLAHLEGANLFVVSLDSIRQWYRYHALFAEALRYQLERRHADLVPVLHRRASQWYAQHQQTTLAILHAFEAKEWHWAADLIEQAYLPLLAFVWGVNRRALGLFRQWVEQLPAEILAGRPQLCQACVHMLWTFAPYPLLFTWLDIAEGALRTRLETPTSAGVSQVHLAPQAQQELQNLLGEVFTLRAILRSYQEDGQAALALCEQAEALLLTENAEFRAVVAVTKLNASYVSVVNDAVAAIESGYQSIRFAQAAGQPAVAITVMTCTIAPLLAAGRLREVERLTQQAMLQGMASDGSRLPEVGWSAIWRVDILREWNELQAACSLITEAISLCERATSLASLPRLYQGYAALLRVCLSCGDLDAACSALQQTEQIGRSMNQPIYLYVYSQFTTIDQVRLWLACGELDRATRWVRELDLVEQHETPFARERHAVACARVYLATAQADLALQRLEPVLQRAIAGQRWGHVIEIRLLQARAYQMLHEEPQALSALAEAVRLGEPEGYIRSFVEEGAAMAVLLCQLREKQRQAGPTPYLDQVLAAFPKPSQTPASQAKSMAKQTPVLPLFKPLSERERQVLQLLAQGRSNQQIAQTLVIALDTVKRHVSHIFSKLCVTNRVQAAKQARELGLLDEPS
jgi:LuxR family maltose regulon positive regulatory protein